MNQYEEIQKAVTGRENDGLWIGTYSGGAAWPNNPNAVDFDIVDIAHALAQSCRWTGHVYKHYSVAEHCVRVAELLKANGADRTTQLKGLLHDASEAYISDIARPSKRQMPEYAVIEGKLMDKLWVSFALGRKYSDAGPIKDADNALLFAEARDLMPPSPMPWKAVNDGAFRYTRRIRPWPALVAEYRFIKKYAELAGDDYSVTRWYKQRWKAFKYFTLGIGRPDTEGEKVKLREGLI